MPKLKTFSGKEVIKIFEAHGFRERRIVGSHMRLKLEQKDSSYYITIPLHDPLKKGTLHGIIKDFEFRFGKDETNKCFFE